MSQANMYGADTLMVVEVASACRWKGHCKGLLHPSKDTSQKEYGVHSLKKNDMSFVRFTMILLSL